MKSLEIIREARRVKREATNNVNEPFTHHSSPLTHVAFTMAEILLSLTIIGVVAAITLPSLTGNINERTWNTQRKALYSRMSQAIALMPALNNFGTVVEGTNATGATVVTSDNSAETFVTSGLSKVIKINNICDNTHLEDCGIVSEYTNIKGVKNTMPNSLHALNSFFNFSWLEVDAAGNAVGPTKTHHNIDTKAVAFESANGESILVFYNPQCKPQNLQTEFMQDKLCANFVYDLNGKKGPNTVGKDIGIMSAVYSSDSVLVAPVPYPTPEGLYSQQEAANVCREQDEDARLPNLEEFMSLAFNQDFTGIGGGNNHFWTSTLVSPTTAKIVHLSFGRVYTFLRTRNGTVQCVKR